MNHNLSVVLCASASLALLAACATTPETAPVAVAITPAAVAITPAAAANMASNCFTCHGPNGRSPGSIPSLHNQNAAAIAAALKAFKSGARPATVMDRQAKGYSDAEIDALAGYIGKLNQKN